MKTGKTLQESFYSLGSLMLNGQDREILASVVAMASKVGCLKKTPDNQKTYTPETRDTLLKALSLGLSAYFERSDELSTFKALHEPTKHEQFCTLFDIDKNAISIEDKKKALDILQTFQNELNQEEAHPVFKSAVSNHSIHDNNNVRNKPINEEQYGILIAHFKQFIQILQVNFIVSNNDSSEAKQEAEQPPTDLMQSILLTSGIASNPLLASQFFDNTPHPEADLTNQLEGSDDNDDDFEIIAPEISEEEMLDALGIGESAMFHKFRQEHDAQYTVLRSAVKSVRSYFFSRNGNTEMHTLLHPDPKDKNAPRVETWEQVKAYAYAKENEATNSRALCDRLCEEIKADYEALLKNKEAQRRLIEEWNKEGNEISEAEKKPLTLT